MKNITVQQAVVLVACLVAPIVAYKLLSSVEAAGATAMVGMVVNFLLGRDAPPPPPPSDPPSGGTGGKTSIGFLTPVGLLAVMALNGCHTFHADDPTDVLHKCAAEAHQAFDDGANLDAAVKVFEDCKKSKGL